MYRLLHLVLALLLALPLLAVPAPVAAEPSVVVSPQSAPEGTERLVAVTGLVAGQRARIEVSPLVPSGQDIADHPPLVSVEVEVGADGLVALDLGTEGLAAGFYFVGVRSIGFGSGVGGTSFRVTPHPGEPSLTVAPETVAPGATVTVSGAGYPANSPFLVQIGEAGGTPFSFYPLMTTAAGTFTLPATTAGFTPGFVYEVVTYPNATQGEPPNADKAYFVLDGPPGTPPAGPRAFTEQFQVAQGDDFTFTLSGFTPGLVLDYFVAEDRNVGFHLLTPVGGVTQTITYQPGTNDTATILAMAGYPIGNYALIVNQPATDNLRADLTAAAPAVIVAAMFTVVGKPTLTVQPSTCVSGFADVPPEHKACAAILALTAQGIIKGYATNPPRFGVADPVQRAQLAAFLVRALLWQAEATGPRSFTDFGGLVGELQTASLILANKCDSTGLCVARGYAPADCVAQGKVAPCFGPNDSVSYAQVLSFVARAFQFAAAYGWVPQPGGVLPYSGVPVVHQTDAKTYHHYAGAIPDAPTTEADWSKPAPRAWVALVLYQALLSAP